MQTTLVALSFCVGSALSSGNTSAADNFHSNVLKSRRVTSAKRRDDKAHMPHGALILFSKSSSSGNTSFSEHVESIRDREDIFVTPDDAIAGVAKAPANFYKRLRRRRAWFLQQRHESKPAARALMHDCGDKPPRSTLHSHDAFVSKDVDDSKSPCLQHLESASHTLLTQDSQELVDMNPSRFQSMSELTSTSTSNSISKSTSKSKSNSKSNSKSDRRESMLSLAERQTQWRTRRIQDKIWTLRGFRRCHAPWRNKGVLSLLQLRQEIDDFNFVDDDFEDDVRDDEDNDAEEEF